MSIFIIHSHKDKDFVDQLATRLAKDRVRVFVDRWEINVGDSIIEKINQAITNASFLLPPYKTRSEAVLILLHLRIVILRRIGDCVGSILN